MKKNLFYLFALICSMSLFTACSDDDEADYTQVIEQEIAGDYKGTLDVSVDGNKLQGGIPKKVTVEKAGPTAINLSLKDFTLIIPVGDVMLHNCQLKEEKNGYSFVGTDKLAVSGLDCTIGVQGTVQGKLLKVKLDVDAKLGAVNQQVEVTFNGEKLNGSEKTEAKITSFTIDSDMITEAPQIDEEAGTITFKVNEAAESLKFAPVIEVSEGATVTPASGSEQDFSNGQTVTYTVVSEDFGTVKEYKAKISGMNTISLFTFDDWTEETVYEPSAPMPTDIWASGAAAASMLGGKDLLIKEDRGDGTYAAKMTTFEYAGEANALLPKITAGSLFSGKFDLTPVFGGGSRLECTQFGVPAEKMIEGKPITFSGWYKYQSGEKFLDASENIQGVVIEGKKDECSIQAVLYEAVDENGDDVQLTGVDINTSEYIVAYAFLEDGTEKAEFTKFEIPFTYSETKAYNPENKYKLAIVCTASRNGDKFQGAGGSVLSVDNFEVLCE